MPSTGHTHARQIQLPPSSLIICSRNRPALLGDTVNSVLSAEERPDELIIVDQSDFRNDAVASLTHPAVRIRYDWTPSVGVSMGRNRGVQSAHHSIVAFLDDDMYVAPNWYGALIGALVKVGPPAAVTGRVLAGPAEAPGAYLNLTVHTWEEPRIHVGRIGRDVLATGHMAVFRSTFQSVGQLDERLGPGTRFPGAEDNDLGFRLLEAGCRIVYEPRSVVYHRSWRGKQAYVPLFWRYGRGQGAFYAKHLRRNDGYMLQRFRADVSRYAHLLPDRVRCRHVLELARSSAFLAGVLAGGAEWLVLNGVGHG